MHVVARTSSFYFKDRPAAIDEIARRLNVGAVLEGSVRRVGTRLRITAHLSDGATGYELWSESFDRDQGDLLRIQREISVSVTQALQARLLPEDTAGVAVGGTENPEALDAYLRGESFLRRYDEASGRLALVAFDEAIHRDARYADAHAGRALALRVIENGALSADVEWNLATRKLALAAAGDAVALAPGSGEAHRVRGEMLLELLDLRGAAAEMSRAIDLIPGSAEMQRDYASFERRMLHSAESMTAARRALTLDPMDGRGYLQLSQCFYYARQYDEALAELRHALVLDVADPSLDMAWMAIIHLAQKKPLLALQDCNGVWTLMISPYCAIALHQLGHMAAAHDELAKLMAALGDNGAYPYAEVYAEWGDRDAAIHWLRKDLAIRDGWMSWLKIDRHFDPIRDAPEFQEIERQMGFPL